MKKLITAVALASLCATAHADSSVYVPNGFFNGHEYHGFNEEQKRFLVAGALDGFFLAPILADKDIPLVRKLGHCMDNMNATDGQLVAIVDRYLETHPVELGRQVHVIVYNALFDACAKNGTPIN